MITRKILVYGLSILFFTGICFLFSNQVQALDYTVCSSGCDYTTIQPAVTACTDTDDRVVVGAGSYAETVTVDHPITITGESNNPSTTKFILSGAPVSITGFSVNTIDVVGKENGGRIQDAIDAVSSGGTVNVYNEGDDAEGTFTDELSIGKSLNLIGSIRSTDQRLLVTLQGSGTAGAGIPITVTTGNVTISRFKIRNSEIGLKVTGGEVTVTEANFNGNTYGIQVSEGAYVVAPNLYWHYSSGPKHTATNPDGQGDEVSDRVAYRPFYTDHPDGTLSTITTDPDGIVNLVGVGTFTIPSDETKNAVSTLTVAEQTTITVDVSGGTHEIILPINTEITKSGGNVFDSDTLTAAADSSSSISGLGSNVELQKAMKWGIPDIGLDFSNNITVKVFVGTGLSGQTLNILRSINGSSGWTTSGIVSPFTCVVSGDGYCQFYASKASHYATTKSTTSSNNSSSGSSGSSSTPQCSNEKPDAPVLYEPNHPLLPKATGYGELRLNWLKANRASKYTIAFGLSSGNYIYGLPDVGDVDNFTVHFLTPGKRYYFVVRGVNDCMPGDWSREWSSLVGTKGSSYFTSTQTSEQTATPTISEKSNTKEEQNIGINTIQSNGSNLNLWQLIVKFFSSIFHR